MILADMEEVEHRLKDGVSVKQQKSKRKHLQYLAFV